MARLRYNGLTATLGAALTSGGTTVTFAAALTHSGGTAVPTIAGGDYIPLTILDATGAVSEIVSLTSYTSGATTGTITRAQESTTATAHASGDAVVHGATVADFSSSGGGSTTSVLAVTEYATSALYNTNSTFDADMDATNLVVTFTAPASGKVMVELSGILEVTGSSPGAWSLRSGTSTVKACMVGTGYRYATARFYITGLTPGDSYTYKWGYYRIGSTGEVRLYTGGNGGTVGNALMVVTAMP
jgi:hypothetical protein